MQCTPFPPTLGDLDVLSGELKLFPLFYSAVLFAPFPMHKVLEYIAHRSLIQVKTVCERILKATRSRNRRGSRSIGIRVPG